MFRIAVMIKLIAMNRDKAINEDAAVRQLFFVGFYWEKNEFQKIKQIIFLALNVTHTQSKYLSIV